MRTIFRRSVVTRLQIIIVLAIVLAGGPPAQTTWAQDSGATSFTIASANGNVVIKRADGSAEMARPGTVLKDGDQLASIGRSEATVNLGAAAPSSGGSGASLLLFSDTTLGIRGAGNGTTTGNRSGGGGFYVADIASGVVLARSLSSSNSTIQITSESAGAVAQLNPGGGMAVSTDVGTGTIAVGCEDRTSKVFFPYVDDRVPCENNVVRTLSNNRSVEDSAADNASPISAAVGAAGTNVAEVQQQQNQPNSSSSSSNDKEKESNSPAIVASPVAGPTSPGGPTVPCNQLTRSGSNVPETRIVEMGRTSGTFIFRYDGGGGIADRFTVSYEGHVLFDLLTVAAAQISLSYSGSSSQITVTVTPDPSPNTTWAYTVFCPS